MRKHKTIILLVFGLLLSGSLIFANLKDIAISLDELWLEILANDTEQAEELNIFASLNIASAVNSQQVKTDSVNSLTKDFNDGYGEIKTKVNNINGFTKDVYGIGYTVQGLYLEPSTFTTDLPELANNRILNTESIITAKELGGFKNDTKSIYSIYNTDLASAIQDVKDAEKLSEETDMMLNDILSHDLVDSSGIVKITDMQYLTNALAIQQLRLSAKNSTTAGNDAQSRAFGLGTVNYNQKQVIGNRLSVTGKEGEN
jgi:hypothetical protein